MILVASKVGEWPIGVHWTDGESRDISTPPGLELPAWLVIVDESDKAPSKKSKTKE